jgi:hypothetical protein
MAIPVARKGRFRARIGGIVRTFTPVVDGSQSIEADVLRGDPRRARDVVTTRDRRRPLRAGNAGLSRWGRTPYFGQVSPFNTVRAFTDHGSDDLFTRGDVRICLELRPLHAPHL